MRHLARLAACAAACLALAAATPAPAATLLGKRAFTRAYAERLQRALPAAKVEVKGDLQVRWVGSGGAEHTSFLDDGWKAYSGDPTALETVLERLVAAALEVGAADGHLVDPRRVVPIVKDRGWLAGARRAAAAGGAGDASAIGEVHEDYNGALTVFYAEDRERGIAYLTAADLARAGLKREGLRALAVRNLKGLVSAVDLQGGDGVYLITAGGDYEASLILVDDLWTGADVAPKVRGEVVVAIPARDLLLVTGSQDAAGLQKLRDLARRVMKEGSDTLTEQLFVRRGGRFVPFDGR